ncbi:hypothetical protein [Ruminococcus albus]|uniref:Uncharacterized protein n=1 Tax=Ruminococcus albus TaxID=1264 RepID=A0A1H7F292_RUMAL|nr:hypothetical protein [Ruminococcus albus]SEK20276.1 hypothetical protein SAMN05216469_10174 [Ruminococcus albus]
MHDNIELFTIGYYICEYTECSDYLGFDSDKFISASDCLCNHEPQYALCHGWKPHGDDKAYIKQFPDMETYIRMSAEINALMEKNLFFSDGRFLRREDALHFYKEYFDSEKYILISVCAEKEFREYLDDSFILDSVIGAVNTDETIGCDIIGWDFYNFHSFLCNSLQKDISGVKFNSYCLIENSYEETKRMAESIQGRGEPVDWLPVIVRKVKVE